MNKVILLGRLTKDPAMRYGNDNKAFAGFTLAVNRSRDEADFIECAAFGKTAELIEKYIRKGSLICVCGQIRTGSYTNKEGVKIHKTQVIVDQISFAESKNQQGSNENSKNIPDTTQEEYSFA